MAMDNMTIRKTQLEKLDVFVKTLYDETQTFKQYGVDLKDVEMLYLHIHEMIQELLSCNTTDEFMAKIEELHKAIAGVLVVMVPAAMAEQIKKDMGDSYEAFDDDAFEEFIAGINKNAKASVKPKADADSEEEDPDNDPDELVDILDLKGHVKKKKTEPVKKKPKADYEDDEMPPDEDTDKEDPLQDVFNNFKQ